MKEVKTTFKESTLAIDFDGVIHKYSKGFQGLENAYDPPREGTEEALKEFISRGYRLIIVSSRPVPVIEEWLLKYGMDHYFDEVTNIKQPAKYYIDDHAVNFNVNSTDPWKEVLKIVE
jgi:FMN phosphatase YigB (HAD superfamily)